MKTGLQNRLSDALLQGNPLSTPAAGSFQPGAPLTEMPMVLTLDELRPNPDNPRTGKNPRYDEIKSSIRQRGLDSVPKVTREPDGDSYIFSDGGNTRYQILSELWQETGEERFYRIHVLFKPWPGRLQCVIGHLAENEVRGELTFIEKARGIQKARGLFEEQQGGKVSLRELSGLLKNSGYPVHASSISRMEDTIRYIYPLMPRLLESGLGRDSVDRLLLLRSCLNKVSEQFYNDADREKLSAVFAGVCHQFDSPELYSREALRDELIGELVRQCPHPELNYERWLFELEVNKSKRGKWGSSDDAIPQENRGDTDGLLRSGNETDSDIISTFSASGASTGGAGDVTISTEGFTPDEQCGSRPSSGRKAPPAPDGPGLSSGDGASVEIQDDLYGGEPVISGDGVASRESGSGVSSLTDALSSGSPGVVFPLSCADIWPAAAHQQDVEHLQGQIYRLVFDLAEALGVSASFLPAGGKVHSSGYLCATDDSPFCQVMDVFSESEDHQYGLPLAFRQLLTGSGRAGSAPLLDDTQFLLWMKLLYLLRSLYAKQRGVDSDVSDDDETETE